MCQTLWLPQGREFCLLCSHGELNPRWALDVLFRLAPGHCRHGKSGLEPNISSVLAGLFQETSFQSFPMSDM